MSTYLPYLYRYKARHISHICCIDYRALNSSQSIRFLNVYHNVLNTVLLKHDLDSPVLQKHSCMNWFTLRMILLCKLPVRLKFEWKYTYTWKFLKFTMLRDQYIKVYFPNWSSYNWQHSVWIFYSVLNKMH